MTSDNKIEIKELLAATLWVSAQLAHPQKKLKSYVACQPEEREVMRHYAGWLLRVARDGEDDATKAFCRITHEFVSDWYRPSRCVNCGMERGHETHGEFSER